MKKRFLLLAWFGIASLAAAVFADSKDNNAAEIGTLIYTAADTFEANRIIAALESAGIPAYTKDNGAGQVLHIYAGYSSFGVQIYVPKDAELTAKSVLEEMGIL